MSDDHRPPPPAWSGTAIADRPDEPLDPAAEPTQQLDPTDLMPTGGAPGSWLARQCGAPPGAPFGAVAAGSARRLARGISVWRAERADLLGAPHPHAEALARTEPNRTTARQYDEWRAELARQADEVRARNRALKAQVRIPAGLACVAVWFGAVCWGWFGALVVGAVVGAVLVRFAWRAGAPNQTVGGAPDGAPNQADGAPFGRTGADLDLATFTDAVASTGLLKDKGPLSMRGLRSMPNGNGMAAWVKLPRGVVAREVVKKRHEIAGWLDTVDSCLLLVPGLSSNRDLYVWLADRPPLADTPTTSPLVTTDRRVDLWVGIPLGTTIQGERIVARLAGTPGWLIAGDSGSGKSFLARLLALGVARDPDATGIFLDPDSSGTWEPFSAIGEYLEGGDDPSLLAMVERLERLAGPELDQRRARVKAYRKANPMGIAESKLTPRVTRDRAAGAPLVVVVVEECHLLLTSRYAARATSALQTLATVGRKWGVIVILLTQYPSTSNLPVEIRNVLATRICLSVATEGGARVALGDVYDGSDMNPVALTSREKGAFYMHGEGLAGDSAWILGRGDLIDDNEAPAVLAGAVALRRRLRPELLPTGPPETPARARLADDDPEHLARLADAFEGAPEQLSEVLVDRLKTAWPDAYPELTVRGMKAWLAPLGLTVERVGPSKRAGLRAATVERALGEQRGEQPGEQR